MAHKVPFVDAELAGSRRQRSNALITTWMKRRKASKVMHGILPVIPPKANRKVPVACDFEAYNNNNRIERMFNRLKQFRRIATRYDKTALSFVSFLCLAAAKLWLPSLSVGPSSFALQQPIGEQACAQQYETAT